MKKDTAMNRRTLSFTPLPEDKTPDGGSQASGGARSLLASLMLALTAFFAAGLALQAGWRAAAVVLWIAFMGPAVWLVWQIRVATLARPGLPRSHNVLAGTLGFEIRSSCKGVAGTAFFYPDRVVAGEPLHLLVFLENHMSRRRAASVRVGPHTGLGLREPLVMSVALAPGQAVVCSLPLTPATVSPVGEHDLPLCLRVDVPGAWGQRLPEAPTHLHDLWTSRLAAPFTVEPAVSPMPGSIAPAEPSCHTLARSSEADVRLAALQSLVAAGWLRLRDGKTGVAGGG